jgi:integrase/recombinase XerD
MSHLSSHIGDYLAMRRALGFKLAKESRLLRDFAAFAEAAGAGTVTTDLAVAWSIMPQNASPVRAAQRLTLVRAFARCLQAVDPATQVPPVGVLPARTRRVTPYIYSDAESRRADDRGPDAAQPAEGSDLRDPDRTARGDRHAG